MFLLCGFPTCDHSNRRGTTVNLLLITIAERLLDSDRQAHRLLSVLNRCFLSSLSNLRDLVPAWCSQVFVELNELTIDKNQEMQWKETARWIKFEEDVEEETDRWGKPHVASLSFRSLLELRKTISHGRWKKKNPTKFRVNHQS